MRFVPNSKELAAAQTEYNNLNSQVNNLMQEQQTLATQERLLFDEVEKEIWGTNWNKPGVHMYNSSFNGNTVPFLFGTNSNVETKATHFNVPPLQ